MNTPLTIKSLSDAMRLARAERPFGLICFSDDDGWCWHVHRTVAEAHRCSEATPARRTYSIRSDAATVHDNGEQRLRDVLAELDRRDSAERETVELPVVELGEAGEGV